MGVFTIVESSEQFIHAKVVIGTEVIHIIAVYAAPTVSRQSGLWGQLKRVLDSIDEPVLVGAISILFYDLMRELEGTVDSHQIR